MNYTKQWSSAPKHLQEGNLVSSEAGFETQRLDGHRYSVGFTVTVETSMLIAGNLVKFQHALLECLKAQHQKIVSMKQAIPCMHMQHA